MKKRDETDLTDNQQKLTRLLELLDRESRDDIDGYADCALWHALTRWKDDLPELDDYFHKCFRQCDVTDDGHTDMIISLLFFMCFLFGTKIIIVSHGMTQRNFAAL
jgi:hypothetical protein